MSKARTLADFISDGSEFADGTISVAEVSGAAPLASPTFTGTVTAGDLTLSDGTPIINITDTDTGVDHQINASSGIGNLAINVDQNNEGSNAGLIFRVGGSGTANQYFRMAANGDTRFYDSSANTMLFIDEDVGVAINDDGVDKDFRVESDTQSHMLFVDASTNRVGINSPTPRQALEVGGSIEAGYGDGRRIAFVSNDSFRQGMSFDLGNRGLNIFSTTSDFGGQIKFLTRNAAGSSDTDYGTQRMKISGNGDITFYQDDGSTSGLFFDASTSNLTLTDSAVYIDYGTLDIRRDSHVSGDKRSTFWVNGAGGYPGNNYFQLGTYGAGLAGIERIRVYGNNNGNNSDVLRINSSDSIIINENSYSTADFRVESDSYTGMLFVDASANQVTMGGTGSNDAAILTLGSPGQATYVTNVTEGEFGIIRYNNTSSSNQHSGIVFRVTTNNASNNSYGSFGLIQPSYNRHDSRFYFNLRSQSNNTRQYANIDSEVGWQINDGGEAHIDFRVESDNFSNALQVDASANRVTVGTKDLYIGSNIWAIRTKSLGFVSTSLSRHKIFDLSGGGTGNDFGVEITVIGTRGGSLNHGYLKVYASGNPYGPNVHFTELHKVAGTTATLRVMYDGSDQGVYIEVQNNSTAAPQFRAIIQGIIPDGIYTG